MALNCRITWGQMECRKEELSHLAQCLNSSFLDNLMKANGRLDVPIDLDDHIVAIRHHCDAIAQLIEHRKRYMDFLARHNVAWDGPQRALGTLCCFPKELLLHIRSFLGIKGTLTCLGVCRYAACRLSSCRLSFHDERGKQHITPAYIVHTCR